MRARDLFKHTRDLTDYRLRLQAGDDMVKVCEVPHFQANAQLGEIRRAPDHFQVVDVAAGLADDLGDLREAAGPVGRGYADQGQETLLRLGIDVPRHVDPVLVLVVLQLRRMDLEDADALPRHHHADDAVAGNG